MRASALSRSPAERALAARRLFLAYSSKRETELLAELSGYPLRRGRKLGYMSVNQKTQQHIYLYEPRDAS